jgi:hypothetical protein
MTDPGLPFAEAFLKSIYTDLFVAHVALHPFYKSCNRDKALSRLPFAAFHYHLQLYLAKIYK